MLFTEREVRIGKTVPEVLSTAWGGTQGRGDALAIRVSSFPLDDGWRTLDTNGLDSARFRWRGRLGYKLWSDRLLALSLIHFLLQYLPHWSLRLSSRALKPKYKDRTHHTVRWRISGSFSPSWPDWNKKPSSSSVSSRADCGRFPLALLTTKSRLRAERTSLDFTNTWSFIIFLLELLSFR